VALVLKEELQAAWKVILEVNPLPFVLGSVCPHPCESNCNRKDYDQAIAMHSLEKFLGSEALKRKWSLPHAKIGPRAAKVAIIGSGPAGLSCAYQLALKGFRVTIFEECPVVGGMLAVGIPDYRLPKNLLAQEIQNNILSLGIQVETSAKVNDKILNNIVAAHDIVFIAVGAQKSVKLNIDGENSAGVFSGLDFLENINLGRVVKVGKEVTVIGGGNTAIDAARSASRLGAKVKVLYRRSHNEMPAIAGEVEEAEKDGVEVQTLVAPARIISQDDRVTRLDCLKMKLGEKDASGRARPVPIEKSNFSILTDMVIVAVGEEGRPDFSGALNKDPKIFAGEVTGTVGTAIKFGRKIAKEIILYLQEGKRIPCQEKEERKLIEFKDLNPAYFEHQGRHSRIVTARSATKEAERCFHCGLCNLCGNCWLFCPDAAINKLDGTYVPNLDYCKGCNICAEECPRDAIFMKEEAE
jgi:NADPH-dependent glutamate synthase beta subunit-like oxidoreductase/Pyruvate/2-oxoacid:ferredoxin oxidoreductase delta subunit